MEVSGYTPLFQAVSTFVVGACVAYVAWRQWITAQQKLSLDLFNSRFDVFDTITSYFLPHSILINAVPDKSKVARAIRQSYFLFNHDIGEELSNAYYTQDHIYSIEKAGAALEKMKNIMARQMPTAR